MADTTQVTAKNTEWTEIIDAGLQAIITPVLPKNTFLIRYASSQPSADIVTGHKFFAKDDIPNAIVGSVNTEKCWIRSINVTDLLVEVSAL